MPTDAELAILQVLWRLESATVREVHDQMGSGVYTTTLKMLQNMHIKGFVHRDESQRSHTYRAAVSEALVQNSLVTELLEKAFGGSAIQLALRALSVKKASPAELAELRRLLAKAADDKGKR
jgi:BlaI family transcriptional regulator, penicillinase repressor